MTFLLQIDQQIRLVVYEKHCSLLDTQALNEH